MSGIFGAIHFGDDRNSDGTDTLFNQKSIIANARYKLSIFGELFLPSGELLTQDNFESEFLSSFQMSPFFAQCEGAYILTLYDLIQKELHLITDPLGNLALHYSWNEETLVFSTTMQSVAEAIQKKQNDEKGIYEYLTLNQTLSGRTLYENVKRLAPASHLVASKDSFRVEKYFTPHFEKAPKNDNPSTIEFIKKSFLRNIEIRTRGDGIRCGLSGGFDSRIIMSALAYLGRKNVELFTIGLPDSSDMRIARIISKSLDFRHSEFLLDDAFILSLSGYWRKTVLSTEGGLGIESSPPFAVWELDDKPPVRYIEGHGGPIYRRQILKPWAHRTERYPSLGYFLFDKLQSPLVSVLQPEVRYEATRHTIGVINEYMDSLPSHLDVGDKIDLYYIQQMCANHYSLAGNAQMQHSKISHPLLSPRIYDVLFTLPSGLRAANTIHKNIIHSYCPSLEKIPLDNSGFQVPYHGYQYLRYLPQLYERFIVPPAGKYFPKLGSFLSVQHSPYTLSMIVSSSPEKLQEIAFSESKHFDQYFSKSAIEKLDVFNPRMVAVATAKILLQEHCR